MCFLLINAKLICVENAVAHINHQMVVLLWLCGCQHFMMMKW